MTDAIFLADEAATLNYAADMSKKINPPCVIYLIGDLGAGKTTFVRGFLQALGYEGNVKSPTYTLVETYHINQQKIYHFDLYRLGHPEELEFIGGRDYFSESAIFLIEWPEKAKGFLPKADLTLQFSYQPNGRLVEVP